MSKASRAWKRVLKKQNAEMHKRAYIHPRKAMSMRSFRRAMHYEDKMMKCIHRALAHVMSSCADGRPQAGWKNRHSGIKANRPFHCWIMKERKNEI